MFCAQCSVKKAVFEPCRIPMYLACFAYWAIALPLGYSVAMTVWLGEPMGVLGWHHYRIDRSGCFYAYETDLDHAPP
ncbi:hypothetical protein ACH42_01805 [Endozoicomonas sp. (ex Bugula neritina AB1)]|nr:hypothetical protein ACH42_01805 [Endozoicomonas sp. (ex Bugula neritina AB1)]